jgi:integrase
MSARSAPAVAPAPATLPGPRTPVLTNRDLRPDARHAELSVFSDPRWDLTPGVFEDHVLGVCIDFARIREGWRQDMKTYFWLLVNLPDPPTRMRRSRATRLCLRSIPLLPPLLNRLLAWCDSRVLASLGHLDTAALDLFLSHLRGLECSTDVKSRVLTEVRRLWSYRELLPERLRLPDPLPWGDDDVRDLVGPTRTALENRTPRIHDTTLVPLLAWAVRFVCDLADDIIPAYRQWAFLSTQGRRNVDPAWRARRPYRSTVSMLLQEVLGDLASHGLGLPGNVGPDGKRRVHWAHLGRLIGHSAAAVQHSREVLEASGLPIDDGAYLLTPVSAQLDGVTWRGRPITFAEAPILARHLSTACYIVAAYLSGMRSGEVLSLQRSAVSLDPTTGLWLLRGRHWKGVTGDDGAKLVTGAVRHDPWVVHEVTARAVAVLERLHDHTWLFPDTIYVGQRQRHRDQRRRVGDARPDVSINRDLGLFTGWVNRYCHAAGRGDSIPADPAGPLTTSRFRRTLAWHIVRQPRGLVAAAIQYGHVKVCITQGYAGSADSGFLDDLSFEDWLLRLEQFADAHRSLLAGQAVSGPSAAEYRRRVGDVAARFAGRVLRTTRQAGQLLAEPALQVFPGRGMHCVFNQTTALCQLRHDDDHRVTPDLDDCRPRCPNIARTDEDIARLRERLLQHEAALADPLSPEPRRTRDQAQVEHLRALIDRHPHPPEPA